MNAPSEPESPWSPPSWAGFSISAAFLALAAWFLTGPALTEVPRTRASLVAAESLSTAPRREIVGDPPKIRINNFERLCTDCHGIFSADNVTPGDRMQHKHIVLDHGINDQCRNCHDYQNMNHLVLYGGEPVAYSDAPRLCQKCHGPTFIDWERGIHGRVNGYWTAERGEPRRLKCIQCHDPHRPRHPAMDPVEPLAGPNTLRMGPATTDHDVEELSEHDPLRRALLNPERGGHESHEPAADRYREEER